MTCQELVVPEDTEGKWKDPKCCREKNPELWMGTLVKEEWTAARWREKKMSVVCVPNSVAPHNQASPKWCGNFSETHEMPILDGSPKEIVRASDLCPGATEVKQRQNLRAQESEA